MYKILFFLFVVSVIIIFPVHTVFGDPEPILITISPSMEEVIFDGKWTFEYEWKPSSWNHYTFDEGKTVFHLRTAHFGDYIYVLVNPVNDLTLDENKDEATICLDAKNNKNVIHDTDDFCFSVSLGNDQGNVLQGTLDENLTNTMEKIENPDDFIAISSASDENDRYTKNIHPTYEFKIPIDLLGRSDNYGFFVSVYDASLDKFYTWPENSTRLDSISIPSPSTWGDIISPDKSLPELHMPFIILIIVTFFIITIQSKLKTGMKYF